MRIVSEFNDSVRTRKVNYKSKRVVTDRTVHFATAGSKTIQLFPEAAADNPKSLYISSDFTLDSETYSTEVTVLTSAPAAIFAFYLYPGQPSVIPIPANAHSLSVSGNAVAGNIRIVVTDNV